MTEMVERASDPEWVALMREAAEVETREQTVELAARIEAYLAKNPK